MNRNDIIYTYRLSNRETQFSYDEAMVVACLQGIINRDVPRVYIASEKNNRPKAWLDLFSSKGEWLYSKKVKILSDLDALVDLAGKRLKGAVLIKAADAFPDSFVKQL